MSFRRKMLFICALQKIREFCRIWLSLNKIVFSPYATNLKEYILMKRNSTSTLEQITKLYPIIKESIFVFPSLNIKAQNHMRKIIKHIKSDVARNLFQISFRRMSFICALQKTPRILSHMLK